MIFETNDEVPNFRQCPRCGERGYDCLITHSYCVNCNFSPVFDEDTETSIPEWALKTLAGEIDLDGIIEPDPKNELIHDLESEPNVA